MGWQACGDLGVLVGVGEGGAGEGVPDPAPRGGRAGQDERVVQARGSLLCPSFLRLHHSSGVPVITYEVKQYTKETIFTKKYCA